MNEFRATHLRRNCFKSIAPMVAFAVIASSVFGVLSADEAPPFAFEADEILAKVDSEVILAADVLPSAIESFNEKKKRCPPEQHEQLFQEAMVSQLMNLVKIKLLYVQALRAIPEDKLPDLKKMIAQDFDDKAVPCFIEHEECKTRQELEEKLQQTGNSIERIKRNFVETQIAQQWFRDQVKEENVKVTNDEALARYRENLASYEHPASVTYGELVAKLSKYANKAEARAALVEMRNLVDKEVSLAEVAKAHSDGSTAAEGGRREILQGSHISRVVDKALFSLPVGTMSPILEDLDPKLKDKRGFYIIRVIDRKPAWTTPFTEVQAELAEELKKERLIIKQMEYMQKIFADTPPWTIFDQPNMATRKRIKSPVKVHR
ncbi:MAG TPA: peptidyl-prolyl cis-trans isomerase [Pirellulales bacterium]|nr:peptidyl-prolyl cis-trans isomerase [Pirellulales bacterium]